MKQATQQQQMKNTYSRNAKKNKSSQLGRKSMQEIHNTGQDSSTTTALHSSGMLLRGPNHTPNARLRIGCTIAGTGGLYRCSHGDCRSRRDEIQVDWWIVQHKISVALLQRTLMEPDMDALYPQPPLLSWPISG
jgi:hypothetical protein